MPATPFARTLTRTVAVVGTPGLLTVTLVIATPDRRGRGDYEPAMGMTMPAPWDGHLTQGGQPWP
jgi:hypothetical protein